MFQMNYSWTFSNRREILKFYGNHGDIVHRMLQWVHNKCVGAISSSFPCPFCVRSLFQKIPLLHKFSRVSSLESSVSSSISPPVKREFEAIHNSLRDIMSTVSNINKPPILPLVPSPPPPPLIPPSSQPSFSNIPPHIAPSSSDIQPANAPTTISVSQAPLPTLHSSVPAPPSSFFRPSRPPKKPFRHLAIILLSSNPGILVS